MTERRELSRGSACWLKYSPVTASIRRTRQERGIADSRADVHVLKARRPQSAFRAGVAGHRPSAAQQIVAAIRPETAGRLVLVDAAVQRSSDPARPRGSTAHRLAVLPAGAPGGPPRGWGSPSSRH